MGAQLDKPQCLRETKGIPSFGTVSTPGCMAWWAEYWLDFKPHMSFG